MATRRADEQFVYVSMNAMYQATISFTSQNYGAGNYHRIRKIMIRAQGCVLVVGLVLGNAATLAGRVLLSIYTTSPPVIEAGLVRMGIVCTTYALCGMMDVMVGGLRGIGYSIMPMLVSLVGACGCCGSPPFFSCPSSTPSRRSTGPIPSAGLLPSAST